MSKGKGNKKATEKKIKKYALPKLIVENVENGQYVQTEAVKNIENIDLK